MLFQRRVDFSAKQSSLALGSTITFNITREFHIESIFLRVKVTPSAAQATANADSLQAIVKKVQLQISDGARTRNVVDVSGPGLLEYAYEVAGGWDRDTSTNFGTNPSSGAKTFYYPIYCSHPQLEDPVGSVFLLPAPRYNSNPVLTVQFASQTDMDTNATPTFAVSAMEADIVINRRQVSRANWPTLDWELAEISNPFPATGNSQLYELQVPGSYTGILMRDYQGLSTRGTLETSGGENKLMLLGTAMRRFRCLDIQAENDVSARLWSSTWNNTTAGAVTYLDFISDKTGETSPDLGSVLDANILAASGARLQLFQDITGGTNYTRKYVTHRVFGNLTTLKFGGGGARQR
jgi:hypothetical protein